MPLPPLTAILSSVVTEGGVPTARDIAFGPHERHRLDVYNPTEPAAGKPVCLFFYGGSWRGGSRAGYGFVGAALARRGIATVIPDYRVYPDVRFPGFVEDAAAACRWIERQPSLAGRPLILAGHSAGAHIAALLALDGQYLDGSARPSALVGLSGPYAFDPVHWPSTARIFATAEHRDEPRPVAHVTPEAPPALLIHGADDRVVKPWNQRELAAAYRRNGVPVRTLELPGKGHVATVAAIARPLRWRAPVLDEIVRFIAETASAPRVTALIS